MDATWVVGQFRDLATKLDEERGNNPEATDCKAKEQLLLRVWQYFDEAGKLTIAAYRRGWLTIDGLDRLVIAYEHPSYSPDDCGQRMAAVPGEPL